MILLINQYKRMIYYDLIKIIKDMLIVENFNNFIFNLQKEVINVYKLYIKIYSI